MGVGTTDGRRLVVVGQRKGGKGYLRVIADLAWFSRQAWLRSPPPSAGERIRQIRQLRM